MNLRAIVNAYIGRIRPRAHDELEWFRSQPSLKTAIDYAGLAISRHGKRYRHQTRIRRLSLRRAHSALSENARRLVRSGSFEHLFSLIESLMEPIKGVGELYVYDTALRIGAKLHLAPTSVYLHAGTRVGARALGFDGKRRTISMSEVPRELRRLRPHEIEDVLCIFKDRFAKAKPGRAWEACYPRSWCA